MWDVGADVLTYVLAVVAAICFGTNWVLQQREAAKASPALQLHPVALLEALVRRPLWLLGLGSLIVGSAAQQVALAGGNLAVVEAVLVLDLVFALFLADRLSNHSVRRHHWLGAVAVCAGLATFLAVAGPSDATTAGSIPRWFLVIVVVGAVDVVLCAAGIARPGSVRAASFATASAITFGLCDAFSTAAFRDTDEASAGALVVLTHWQIYGVVIAAAVALGMGQVAFSAAALPVSLPSLAVAEPVSGLLIGVSVLGVSVGHSTGALVGEFLGAAAVVVGSIVVGQAKVLHVVPRPGKHPPHESADRTAVAVDDAGGP
ncbi:MAG: DMT family transporter [Mycobacteriales bacterium]